MDTWTVPVYAPAGTVVVIRELETTVKTAGVPWNVTLVAPVMSYPRILTAAGCPTFADLAKVGIFGPSSHRLEQWKAQKH